MICSCNNVQHLNYLIPLFVHHSLLLGVTLRLAAFSLLLPARSDPATSATRFLPEVSARLCRLFTYLLTYLLTGRISGLGSCCCWQQQGSKNEYSIQLHGWTFATAFFLSFCLSPICLCSPYCVGNFPNFRLIREPPKPLNGLEFRA